MSNLVRPFDESALRTLPTAFDILREKGVLTPIITLESLKAGLNTGQWAIVEQVINLSPADYGVKTPYAGDLEPVPSDLVKVDGQQYTDHGELKTLDERYVPRRIFDAYTEMNGAFVAECPDRKLLVGSCYRSPAYQIVVFVHWLINGYGGDIAKTIRQASPPNYSQHTIASKAAIDFMNIDGSPSDSDPEGFRDTIEYAWLRRHANSFGFYESWPEGNEFGMKAEPWHWQFRAKAV